MIIGMVTPDLICCAHMTKLIIAIEILQQTKPNIVHCPESNMKLVSWLCPVEKLTKWALMLRLGTDGAASNNDLDMIGEMRTASFLGKVTANSPIALSAEQVLKMATNHGAKTLGIDHLTGTLTPGKLLILSPSIWNKLRTQPLYHPISRLCTPLHANK